MRIFVAGATGAVGRRLVPLLTQRGHEVVGTTRSIVKADQVRTGGGTPVVLDLLDRDSVLDAVAKAAPEVIIHEATALAGAFDLRHFDEYFAVTNRLRTKGTDNLLAAAQASGVRRFVAQSYAGWTYPRTGPLVQTETDPLDDHPAGNSVQTLAAIKYLERVTTAVPVEGVVLRYGGLYGPGNGLGRDDGRDGETLAMVRKGRFPVVGGGWGVWSFLHIDDAASATALAVEGQPLGIFNIVDDEPAEVRTWLPYLAEAIGGRRPLPVPAWLARPLLGEHGINMMTQARGAANGRARSDLGWVPRYASWREGFRTGLG
jgi:nucleoside-diphosphate-sugar epimerase